MDAKRNAARPNTTSGRVRLLLRGFLTAALGVAVAPQPAVGQAGRERVSDARPGDTVTVVAGRHYGTSRLHRFFFGGAHRDLWTTPVRVEVLDMSTYAGGLTPIRRGGGATTRTLHLQGADGKRYVFRSVDKDPTLPQGLAEELRETFVFSVVRDQISAYHPYAAFVVAPLLEAAGVLHATPVLRVAPDDPRLGEFRAEFGGLLGILEERPNEGDADSPGFAGATNVVGSDRLFQNLNEDPSHRVNARSFLEARLIDIFLGDRDRWSDNWRWASFESGDQTLWEPIPRDRDQAFVRMNGLALWLLHFYQPRVVAFGEDYPDIAGLTRNGWDLDRRFLVSLDKTVWDSTVTALQGNLTDEVINRAVRNLPPEIYQAAGEELTRALIKRRDNLPRAADKFYSIIVREAEIHATDKPELAEVIRAADDRVEVRLYLRDPATGAVQGAPYFRHTFYAEDTKEIRLYLHGGRDRAVVSGAARQSIRVRVIGGAGADELVDSSVARTDFYDAGDRTLFVTGSHTSVNRKRYVRPPSRQASYQDPADFGSWLRPHPWVTFEPDIGLFIGGGARFYKYGFRRHPYHYAIGLRVGYATRAERFRVEYSSTTYLLDGSAQSRLHVLASGIESVRFYGFGNDTELGSNPTSFFKVTQEQYHFEPSVAISPSRASALSFGLVAKLARTDTTQPGTLIQQQAATLYGAGSFGQLGAWADVSLDLRDRPVAASRGWFLTVGGRAYPALWDVDETFGDLHGELAVHLTAPIPGEPSLAMRAGGKKVFGAFPFHEAAYLGAKTIRGYAQHRFAGDAVLYGNMELRVRLADFSVILPGTFGVFGLADAGRVYLDGASPSGWHKAFGGGIWLSFMDRLNTASIAVAQSPERTSVYMGAGFFF